MIDRHLLRSAHRTLREQRLFGQFGPASPCRQLNPATLTVLATVPATVSPDPHLTITAAVAERRARELQIRQQRLQQMATIAARRARKARGDDDEN